MESAMKAMCGAYCGACAWKDRFRCPGCIACGSKAFWGECDKAKCCMERGLEHCGFCPDATCTKLQKLFADPEHGDGGARLRNLRNWANGADTYEALR